MNILEEVLKTQTMETRTFVYGDLEKKEIEIVGGKATVIFPENFVNCVGKVLYRNPFLEMQATLALGAKNRKERKKNIPGGDSLSLTCLETKFGSLFMFQHADALSPASLEREKQITQSLLKNTSASVCNFVTAHCPWIREGNLVNSPGVHSLGEKEFIFSPDFKNWLNTLGSWLTEEAEKNNGGRLFAQMPTLTALIKQSLSDLVMAKAVFFRNEFAPVLEILKKIENQEKLKHPLANWYFNSLFGFTVVAIPKDNALSACVSLRSNADSFAFAQPLYDESYPYPQLNCIDSNEKADNIINVEVAKVGESESEKRKLQKPRAFYATFPVNADLWLPAEHRQAKADIESTTTTAIHEIPLLYKPEMVVISDGNIFPDGIPRDDVSVETQIKQAVDALEEHEPGDLQLIFDEMHLTGDDRSLGHVKITPNYFREVKT